MTPHSPEIHKWSLNTGFSLVSYSGHLFLWGEGSYWTAEDTVGIFTDESISQQILLNVSNKDLIIIIIIIIIRRRRRRRRRMIGKGTGRLGNKSMCGDHPDISTVDIGPNTEKSPGNLRSLAVTETPVRNHQLKPVWKTRKGVIKIIIGTISKALVKGLEDLKIRRQVGTIQTRALLRSPRIQRRGALPLLKLQWETIS